MLKNFWNLLRNKGDVVTTIKGDRCLLKPFVPNDTMEVTKLLIRNKLYWSTYEPIHLENYYTEQVQYKKIVEGMHLRSLNREFSYGIYELNSRYLIGMISLYSIKRIPFSSAFIGYSIDEQYSGKGITSEAVLLVLEFAFNTLRLNRLEAYVAPGNVASIRVLEKAGFEKEGLLRKLLYINGEWVDHFIYAVLSEEYYKKQTEALN